MLHRPEQPGAPSASLSPTSTTATAVATTSPFASFSSSSPPSTSRASTLDTSSLFIPRRRPPPPSNLRASLNSRNATGTGKTSYSSLRRVSAPGVSGSMKTMGFSKGNGNFFGGSGDGDGDAMVDLQSEMDGVSLHQQHQRHQQHQQHYHTQDLAAHSSSSSSHELAVDIKRRLFNDGPPSQLAQAHAPWQASTSPEEKQDYARSPVKRISQAGAGAGARDSPPRMGILTRSKVSRTGSVRISEAPQRRGSSSSDAAGGAYHDGLTANGHGHRSDARGGGGGGGGAALPANRSSPRCSPLRARGRGRAATPYPGEIAQPQAHLEAPPAGSSSSSSASSSLHPPHPQLQTEEPPKLLSSSPLSPHSNSNSLSSSYPSANTTTRPSTTTTSTSTILLSHVESSSLQRAHFLSERAKEEERDLLRGLEMCTGLGRRLGGWEGGIRAGNAGQEGGGDEDRDGEGDGLVVKSRKGGRDRWVLATGGNSSSSAISHDNGDDKADGDEDLQYWKHIHLQAGMSGENGEAAEGEGDQDVDYAHEEEEEEGDEDLFGNGDGNGDRDELFDLDDDDEDDLDDDNGRKNGGALANARSRSRGRGMEMGMDAVHESFDEDEEYSVQDDEGNDEEEEERWSR